MKMKKKDREFDELLLEKGFVKTTEERETKYIKTYGSLAITVYAFEGLDQVQIVYHQGRETRKKIYKTKGLAVKGMRCTLECQCKTF